MSKELGDAVVSSLPVRPRVDAWGYWLTRLVEHEDIRDHGSGTSAVRTSGACTAGGSGFRSSSSTPQGIRAGACRDSVVSHLVGVLAGGAAMLGHWRPLFLRWQRGGKMVATCGGAFLGVAPVVGGIGAAVWLAVFLVFRYASLASILAALSLPVAAVLLRSRGPLSFLPP
jgi:glycerol-3-phosphate acyltransferase PlsY